MVDRAALIYTVGALLILFAAPARADQFNTSCMQVRYYAGTAQDARHNMELALHEHNSQLARQESGFAWTDMKRGDNYLHGCTDRAAKAVFDRELIKLCTDMRGAGFMAVQRADQLIKRAQDNLQLQQL